MARPSQSLPPILVALLQTALLSGCLGGSVAQQIASSVATQAVDHAVGSVVDAQLRQERELRPINMKNTEPDPFVAKFLFMQFPDPEAVQVVIEPLPPQARLIDTQPNIDSNRLVSVEIWNLVIGQEKQAILERGLQNGSTVLPPQSAWDDWQLATGSLQHQTSPLLYFLLPPDFGRVSSGDLAIIEIAKLGGVHMARYRTN